MFFYFFRVLSFKLVIALETCCFFNTASSQCPPSNFSSTPREGPSFLLSMSKYLRTSKSGTLFLPQEKWLYCLLYLIVFLGGRCLFISHSLSSSLFYLSRIFWNPTSCLTLPSILPIGGMLVTYLKTQCILPTPSASHNEGSLISLFAQHLCLGVCQVSSVRGCFYLPLPTHSYGSRYLG